MKRVVNIAIFMLVFFGSIAAVTWYQAENRSPADVMEDRIAQCDERKQTIETKLRSGNYCFEDSDCRAVVVGCPWGDLEPCRHVVVHKNFSVSAVQQEVQKFGPCMTHDDASKEKYNACLSARPEGVNECNTQLRDMRLACVDRKCVRMDEVPNQ